MIIKNPTPELINLNSVNTLEGFFFVEFPQDYKNFLLKTNGGIPNLPFFLHKHTKEEYTIKQFFGICPGYEGSILERYAKYLGRIPKNTLSIASTPGGNLILISISGPDYGKVYYWDHNWEVEDGETPDYSNLSLIADSFDEFLSMLKSEEEIDALESSNNG